MNCVWILLWKLKDVCVYFFIFSQFGLSQVHNIEVACFYVLFFKWSWVRQQSSEEVKKLFFLYMFRFFMSQSGVYMYNFLWKPKEVFILMCAFWGSWESCLCVYVHGRIFKKFLSFVSFASYSLACAKLC
jgi:hypothetical protein